MAVLYKSLIFSWIFNFSVVLISGQSPGDECSTRTDEPGVCSTIEGCPSILNDLRQGKRNHAVCGFEGFIQIVCCPIITFNTTARVSIRKCDEYKDLAYDKVLLGNVFNGPALERKATNCAFTSVPLIVGGTEAKHREFPHMALIGFRDGATIRWDCGGTLISDEFVLSAAHCTFSPGFGPAIYVRLGEHDISRTDDITRIDLNIIERIPHPNYKYPLRYNDIALFKLERKVRIDGAIRPACLPEQSAIPTKKAIASGWGSVEFRGDRSNVLLKVILEIFSQAECASTFKTESNRKLNKGIVEEGQVCAGSKEDEKDTCQGDSGGPLQIYHKTHHCTYTIVGVTSFGKACGYINTPGVYTRVYAYLNWIEGVVWPNE